MNFFNGSIVEAVSLSKSKDAIFVVFVKGTNDGSNKLDQMLNKPEVRSRLESDDFVVIKISSHEQAYIQFASIYQVVPIPSIFFIGKNGTPLEIVTDIIPSSDELETKIQNALKVHGKNEKSSSHSFIAEEQAAAVRDVHANVLTSETEKLANSTEIEIQNINKEKNTTLTETTTVTVDENNQKKPLEEEKAPEPTIKPNEKPLEVSVVESGGASTSKIVCDGNVCKILDNQGTTVTPVESTISVEEKNNEEAKERMRKLLEQKRRERVLEEQRLDKERELRRRADAKAAQNVREWQKTNELNELKQNIKRERLADQEARERIRAQIQADRAERAQMNLVNKPSESIVSTPPNQPQQKPVITSEDTKLQFRLPSGEHFMNVFKVNQTLGDVRSYVKVELLANTGIRDFYLATSYPRQEYSPADDIKTLADLGLIPNGVILVIAKESKMSPSSLINRSGGVINIFTMLLRVLMTPFMSVYGYVQSMFRKRPADNDNDAPPRTRFAENYDAMGPSTSKDAAASSNNQSQSNTTKAYRRVGGSNIHRLTDNRKNSDDENATWNGNSTQQQ